MKRIIEIDGSIHDFEEIKICDEEREKCLIALGYKIIRFSNKQVYNNPEFMLAEINFIIKEKLQKQILT